MSVQLHWNHGSASSGIRVHLGWNTQYAPGRHAKEIQDFKNAIVNCKEIYQKRCNTPQCPPEKIDVKEVVRVLTLVIVVVVVVVVTKQPPRLQPF
jgi:hypothetical protein